MRVLTTTRPDFPSVLEALLGSRSEPAPSEAVLARVRGIIADVRSNGDEALIRLTRELDRWDGQELVLPTRLLHEAREQLPARVVADLVLARDRIAAVHRRQRERDVELDAEDGVYLAQRHVPLRRVGLYVPGGTAAYPSSVLMSAVPAKVAGVDEVIMVTPTPDGVVNPVVLAAAALAGVDRVVRIGGAQAVAARAYGTASVPRVDKIVGPGNTWVATAKREVFGAVGIDSIAGPSELCVVATPDGGASPRVLAADLLSQAEHDPAAMVSFLSPDAALVEAVVAECREQARALPRAAIAEASLRDFGIAVVTRSLEEALDLAERIAPEHLELVVPHAERLAGRFRSAGAIFCGPHTPEAVGDYLAGANHVLPTNGTARFFSPLGTSDFMRRTNVIRFNRQAIERLGPPTIRLAELEGLEGHARSVRFRLEP